ncbi:multidrug effflux MFS transporter [Pseudomarimonas arenosa]|uniref:Bcr/CflA family efflux transporter n=1 Tax=Pseudomarimonas arenosa TaxID=2774145 RepID=A0AAW3ZNI0_9GAMM|nr:multidrug effflux MFS transporter [Pseudomarimonas arenosa]MBD8527718.1 multidrug effflux MFS transporter [Pseudomarimonas arenosa]
MPRTLNSAPGGLVWLLGALAMFGPFAIDTLFPAFPLLAQEFDASPMAIQQTISVYLVAYAGFSLVHGPLSDSFGRRPVILAGVTVFGLASVGCALSESLTELLVYRALQGSSAGVGLIVGRAIIRDRLEGPAAQRMMAMVSMVFSVAPAMAPIIGGWIIGFAPWQWIFWALALFSTLLLIAVMLFLGESHPQDLRQQFRLGPLLRSNWAITRNPQFARLAIAGGFNFGALFLYIASAPAFVLDILKLNAQQFGWFFVPMISGMAIGAFVSSRLAERWTADQMVMRGFAATVLAGVINIAYQWVPEPAVPWAVLPMTLLAFGIALVFPAIMLAMLDMYPRQRGSASSIQTVLSLSVNATIAGLVSPLISHSAWSLALGSATFSLIAIIIWRSYRRRVIRKPNYPGGDRLPELEPIDRL